MRPPSAHGSRPPLRLRWILLAAVAGAGLLVNELIGESGYLQRQEQQERIAELSAEIEQLRKENEVLAQRVRNLRSNPAAIEEFAREKLHLARPGELVVTLRAPADAGEPADEAEQDPSAKPPDE